MPDTFDCVTCGACGFRKNPRYLVLLPEDEAARRSLPPSSLFEHEGCTYVDFSCGHCVHLQLGGGRAVCGVYEARPEACRAFRAGSFECMKARRANGMLGANIAAPQDRCRSCKPEACACRGAWPGTPPAQAANMAHFFWTAASEERRVASSMLRALRESSACLSNPI